MSLLHRCNLHNLRLNSIKTIIMTTQKLLLDLHKENIEWVNTLAFYVDDIKILKSRIAEVASKNSNKEILAMVEHFQNQLIIQKDEIDKLKHAINEHEDYLKKHASENSVALEKQKENDHPRMRDQVGAFIRLFDEMRKDLYRFLSRTM